MSPNPDACDEELPFREGQLIKVYGEKDADGFYWGEAGNRTGYVPCNMVSEVQVIFSLVVMRLTLVNNSIEYSLLNKSFNTFKLKCKELFLK